MNRVPSVVPSSLDFSDGSYLAALLKQVVADLGKFKDRGAITDDTPEVNGLCFVLEKIFLHELKTGPRGHFWEFVERLQDSLPGNQAAGMLEKLRTWTRSPAGRCRAFIRLSLNQRTIIEYLQALVWNTALVQGFYTRGAFFRNEHLVAEMMDQLDVILPLQFSLTMHFADLDKDDYWNAYRTIIHDLHIRVITGRESEFKFGLLSVEGDERRRRERERQRSNLGREDSMVSDNGSAPSATVAPIQDANSAQIQVVAKEEPAQVDSIETRTTEIREQEEKVKEEQERDRARLEAERKREAEEEEERVKRKQLEEEEERRRLEEFERQRLEEEERMVLEEARRLEEELAWRRRQRELARKKARGDNRKSKKQEKLKSESNGHQGIDDVQAEAAQNASSTASIEQAHETGDMIPIPDDPLIKEVSSSESESETSVQVKRNQATVTDPPSAQDSTSEDEDKSSMTLHHVEKMLRELEERRLKLMQTQGELTISASEPAAASPQKDEVQDLDSLLEELTLAELDNLEEVIKFCEELEDANSDAEGNHRGAERQLSMEGLEMNGQNDAHTTAAVAMKRLDSKSLHPDESLLGRSHIERTQHLDEVLRFCDELDEELVGVEFEQNVNKQIQKTRLANSSMPDHPNIRIFSSSPGAFQPSFKREGVWGSMKQGGQLNVPVGSLGVAGPRLDHLKMKLSSSPKREMLIFHLQQKRAEREVLRNSYKASGFVIEHQNEQQKLASNGGEITIEKESATTNFTRGRTGSLLSKGLGESGLSSSLAEAKETKSPLSRSSPSTPTHYSSDGAVEVIRPTVGARKNYRNSYYQALKLHSPSLPNPGGVSPLVRKINAERRQARSAERAANRRSVESPSDAQRDHTMDPAARRKLEFDRGALTASGRSVTIAATADSQREKNVPVGSASADTSAGITRRMSMTDALPNKMKRPVWAPDSEHSQCGLCEASFSLVVRRHHCRVCGQIFCSKCIVKASVPDLDYMSPVPVCNLCFTTLPPTPST